MIRRSQGLDRSIAFITGGASGIGRALGGEVARQGAKVVLADHDAVALTAATDQLSAEGLDVSAMELDVTDRDEFTRAVDGLIATHGAIDLLVNSAGVSMGGPTHELAGAHWDRVLDVNLGGVVNGVLAAYPHMVDAGQGRIVNIASAAGLVSPPFVAAYATSKHAVVGLSLALHPEAAIHGVGISVVCPGAVETPILDRPPPSDLPTTKTAPVTARAYLSAVGQSPIDVDRFAKATIRRVLKGQAVIIVPKRGRALWLLNRASPRLTLRATGLLAAKVQRELLTTPAARQGSSG